MATSNKKRGTIILPIILLGTAAYFLFFHKGKKKTAVSATKKKLASGGFGGGGAYSPVEQAIVTPGPVTPGTMESQEININIPAPVYTPVNETVEREVEEGRVISRPKEPAEPVPFKPVVPETGEIGGRGSTGTREVETNREVDVSQQSTNFTGNGMPFLDRS